MGPALLAIFLEHPAFLGIVVVGLVARPWLPDPLLYLRYLARTRRLEGEIRVNRANVTARRDLSLIWLEKRRAKRALPLLEEALAKTRARSSCCNCAASACFNDAEDALEHFIVENRSSVEGQYKRALVARGRGNRPAFKEGLREARNLYRDVPRYQQRRQFSWYVRALFSSVLG